MEQTIFVDYISQNSSRLCFQQCIKNHRQISVAAAHMRLATTDIIVQRRDDKNEQITGYLWIASPLPLPPEAAVKKRSFRYPLDASYYKGIN